MRIEYIHNLRGLAILLVVLAHAISALATVGELEYLRYLLINCSVFFVVIGGFLFAEIAPKYTYKKYLIGKCKSVLLPYFILSMPAALIYILKIKTNHSWVDMDYFYHANFIYQYLYLMITGAHLGPLWFIPMIILFYLLFPLLNFINRKNVLGIVLIISMLIGVYVGRPEFNANVWQSFLYFLPAYLGGMWLHKNQRIILSLKKRSLVCTLLVVCVCLGCYYFWDYSTEIDLVLKLLLSLCLFSLFAQYYNTPNSVLNKFAQISFFLFFIHGYFIGVLRGIIAKGYLDFNGVTVVLINFSAVLLCSLITYYLLNIYLPKNKMFMLGVSKG